MLQFFLDHRWNTQKPAGTPKPLGSTTRVFTLRSAAWNWQILALLRNPGSHCFAIQAG